jgi:hypothetical protein
VPETTAEQDEAIRAVAETEFEHLEAQQGNKVEDDLTDSSDEDYQLIPHMPPQAHDREASGSSSAPPQPPQTDPALIAILDRM